MAAAGALASDLLKRNASFKNSVNRPWPGHAAQQRGFARTIGADQRRDRAGGYVQAHALQRAVPGVVEHQSFNADHGFFLAQMIL